MEQELNPAVSVQRDGFAVTALVSWAPQGA